MKYFILGFLAAQTRQANEPMVRVFSKGNYVARARTMLKEPGIAVKFLFYCEQVLLPDLFGIENRRSSGE